MGGASRESISVVLSLMDTAPSTVLLSYPSIGCLVPVLVHQCLATLPFLCTPAPDLDLVQIHYTQKLSPYGLQNGSCALPLL